MKKVLIAVSVVVVSCGVARAHCDTLDGPVVADAREALKKGDVTPALKWVKKEAEPEIRAAFEKALAERKSDQSGADMKFFGTLVRVHRAGEGAAFTGLKPAGLVEPVILKSDKALEGGSVDALARELSRHLSHGIRERFSRALKAKKHKDESVEAGREYVEAYVEYTYYVEGAHNAISGKAGHHD